MLNIDLNGRVILVLGGSRGIGAGITEMLCRAGATVTFTHRGQPQHQQRIDELPAAINGLPGSAMPVQADACDSAETQHVVQDIIGRHGRIDGLVCNVGQTLRRPVEEVTDESWRRFVDVNLSTSFYAIRAVLQHMAAAHYGRIVLIGSSAFYDGGGGAIDYAAAKSGLHGMMLYLVRNYARKGILTNIVHPCVIDTDLLREGYDSPRKIESLIGQIPVGRLGKPEDIAGVVAFLVSSYGDFICGQSILVDGGRTFF